MSHYPDNLDPSDDSGSPAPASRGQFTRRGSTRFASHQDHPFTAGDPADTVAAGEVLRPSLSRRNSTNLPSEPYRRGRVVTFRDDDDEAADEEGGGHPETIRTLSAREAVAAQIAAEAAEAAKGGGGGGMMSLMDLLEETDREMGLEGSRYILSDDDDDDDYDDEEIGGKVEGGVGGGGGGGIGDEEYTCCVCKVRHKGNAFASCGHTFCRMCSRDLNAYKGNCPLCNNFILEILEIF